MSALLSRRFRSPSTAEVAGTLAWRLWPRGLWGRAALSFMVAVAPLLALLFMVISAEGERVVSNAEWEASQAARLGAEQQESMLRGAASLLRVLSRASMVQEPGCGEFLASVVATVPHVASISAVD